MNDYCSPPPFMGASQQPNILVVLDSSGSMNMQAYAGVYDPSQFPGGKYYGYFDSTRNYRFEGGRWAVTGDDLSTATLDNPIASGDLLNWATMRRVDVAKKLLIGGKTTSSSPVSGSSVKLYGEDPTDNSGFSGDFDSSTVPGIVAPFNGNYRYQMDGDELSIVYLSQGVQNPSRPIGAVVAPPAWAVSGAATTWEAVNEVNADDSGSYISNSNSQDAILFDYSFNGTTAGSIDRIVIKVRARKTGSAGMELQAALQITGQGYPSYSTGLSTDYATYSFEYAVNPETGTPWQWSDVQGSLSPGGQLKAFGVQAETAPSGGSSLEVSQVYLEIITSTSSGGPYRLVVDQGTQPATGLIHHLSQQARFGVAFYNQGVGLEDVPPDTSKDGGRVVTAIGFNNAGSIMTEIEAMAPGGWTPLAETVFEMLNYFRQDNYYYSSADFSVGDDYDPYYYKYSTVSGPGYPDMKVKCAKSYILLLTDGESKQDLNIPDTLKDFDKDGLDATLTADNGSNYLDDIALWGRTTDQRADLDGTQSVYLYPVFMFGSGSDVLKDAAINGGFDDLNGDGAPGPNLKEYLRDSDGDGSLTASDLPRTYFEGDDGYELEESITEALTDMVDRAGSGTAVSLLSSSSRGVGSLLNAYYQSSVLDGVREVTWTGYVQNFWVDTKDNLREDTGVDARLQLHKDRVIKMYHDADSNAASAGIFTTDENGLGGTLEACGSVGSVDIEYKAFNDLTPIWKAGLKLAEKSPDTRNLFTSKKVISSTKTTDIPVNDFTVSNVTGATLLNDALDADATYSAEEIVRYIRGENLEATDSKFRDRRLSVNGALKPWRLGDIVNSTPKTISSFPVNSYHTFYGDLSYFNYFTSSAYQTRAAVAVMGANDGMVHAFRVGYLKERGLTAQEQADFVKAKLINTSISTQNDELGDEVWGYLPFNAFPYLKYLANPDYCHIYYNDLSTRLLDASINGNAGDVRAVGSWKSLLLGGMRFGGSCATGTPVPPAGVTDVGHSAYYVLDVTDPESPVPLWEFSAADLGYATTYPAIVRTGSGGENGNWYMVVGSGSKRLPKGNTDIDRDSNGYLYFIDLRDGTLTKKIGLGHNAIVGDLLSVDADKDYQAEKLYFGTSYKSGNIWNGKLMSMTLPANLNDLCGGGRDRTMAQCVAAAGSDLTVLFDNVYPFTASPDALKGEKNLTWVFQGSGKYYSNVDGADTSEQIFLGFKDLQRTVALAELDDSADPSDANNITAGNVADSIPYCLFDEGAKKFKLKDVIVKVHATNIPVTRNIGWYLKLNGGERVISRPLGIGGLVDFLTYRPSGADPCSYGGETFLYALDYRSGIAPAEVAIPLNDAVDENSGTYTVKKGVRLGPGAPPTGEGITLTPRRRGDRSGLRNKKIQAGSGVIHEVQNNPIFDVNSQIIHWLEK